MEPDPGPLGPHAVEVSSLGGDKVFAGSIPKLYEAYLVPLIFEPYAADLVDRLASKSLTRALEIAAGTGVVTRKLASVLPDGVSIVATDLNQSMLDLASTVGTKRPVEWRQADAMQLPFQDGMFDAVVCQFGVMFFPEKSKAFSEARRVLRSERVFIFNVWDRIEENEFADIVTTALESLFPEDPPRFGPHAPRLLRPSDHRARPGRRRVPFATPSQSGCRAQSGRIFPGPGGRVLPGNAAAERDRGTRRLAAR